MAHILLKDSMEVMGVVKDISRRSVKDVHEAIALLINDHFDLNLDTYFEISEEMIISWRDYSFRHDTIKFEDEDGTLYIIDVEKTFIY